MKDQALTIGCVISLGIGVLIGHLTTPAAAPMGMPLVPNNYDSARSIASDAMKSARDSEQNCWAQVITLLGKKSDEAKKTDETH